MADECYKNGQESEAKGDLAAAAIHYRKSFSTRLRFMGHTDPQVMETAKKLASIAHDQKDYESAESYLNWCLKAKAKQHGAGSFEFAETQDALGNLYMEQKLYEKAIDKYKQVVALKERYEGPTSKATFSARKKLAKAYLKSGDREKFREIMDTAMVAYAPGKDPSEVTLPPPADDE